MASHQRFGKMEDQHSISNSTNSSSAAGSRENSHKISVYKNKVEKCDCSNYHLSIAGKMLSRVLLNRLIPTIAEEHLPGSQCGFKANWGTTDMGFTLRQIQQKCLEQKHRIVHHLGRPNKSV